MPGNHKRTRKARAKQAEKRRSSSDRNEASRKSYATEETLGAVGGSNSSDSSSPVKGDDEFNVGPLSDFVLSVGGSLEREVNDAIEALRLDVGESVTVQKDDATSDLNPVDDASAVGSWSPNITREELKLLKQPSSDKKEMGSTASHVPPPEGTRPILDKIEQSENIITDKEFSFSKSNNSEGSSDITGSLTQHVLPGTCKEKHHSSKKPGSKNVNGTGSSVDPPSYEQCDFQREISLRVEALEVKSVPVEGQCLISLEQAPVMKFKHTADLSSESSKVVKRIPDKNVSRDTSTVIGSFNVVSDYTGAQKMAAMDSRSPNTNIQKNNATTTTDHAVDLNTVPPLVVTKSGDNRLKEAANQDLPLRIVERVDPEVTGCREKTESDKETTFGTADDSKASKKADLHFVSTTEEIVPETAAVGLFASYDPHKPVCEEMAQERAAIVEEIHEFEELGFSVSAKPVHPVSLKASDEHVSDEADESNTSKASANLPAGFGDTGTSLSPDQIDIVTTYIDQLFEACFDPDMTGRDSLHLGHPEATDTDKEGTCVAASDLDLETDQTTNWSSAAVAAAATDAETRPCSKLKTTDSDQLLIVSSDKRELPISLSSAVVEVASTNSDNLHGSNPNTSDIEHLRSSDKTKPKTESETQADDSKLATKDKSSEDVQSDSLQDSNPTRNLPDVVSSSTSVSTNSCVVDTKGLPVAIDMQWRSCFIYLSQVYNIYKLLEALYNSMCVSFRGSVWDKEPDVTSRVILQCKGARLTGAAIQSLDSLNDQIVQYIFAQNNVDLDLEKDLSPRERETLKSSMVLIRGLLIDAQSKFRKMVDDNRQLAVKIDGSIQAANQEVNVLRAELADTNKRLSQITLTNDLKVDKATQSESENGVRHKSDEENELTKMKEENVRLEAQVKSLTREVQELKLVKAASSEQPSYGELKLELIQTRQEVNRAKEALQAMKADRKRLKGEKLDLLNQMKQLYTTLEDKESELRDFIRNYEQRVRESDETIKQLAMEKEECEREKWRIIKKAQEAAERSVILRSQCDTKDQTLKKLEVELAELRTQPSDHNKSSISTSEADNTAHSVASTIASEELPPYTPSQSDASRDDSFSVKTSTPSHDSRLNSLTNPNKLLNTSHELPEQESKKKHRIPVFGSLTRMFSKGRLRRSIALPHGETFDDPGHPKLALLGTDNYTEKLALVNGLKGVHMTNWKANQVLAWLEISLSMPIYGKMCAENIKSGKVLLGLSDSDLGAALGITNSIHRRKLRLAIEEQRDPGEIKYSKAANIDHTWVSHRWLPDLGLPQHSGQFESQLADGRLLNQLSKKDLEKHFSVHRKFHQASILHAIELLRLLNFDKELLSERRAQCEDANSDPLVWTNERVMKWIKSIELGEYVQNLKESGVHGALMVLEPSFTADTLATALGIPPSKSYLRRHIATELEALIKPARAALDTPNNNTKMRINGTGSVGRSFIRSYRSSSLDDGGPKGRLSFRGSLGRAFGRKIKDDLRMTFDSDTTPRSRRGIKISDPIPIQHNHSLDSIVEPDSTAV